MGRLKHFSHEHPLILNEDHAQEGVNCCGCNKSILIGESAYSCTARINTRTRYIFFRHKKCDNFFLHKKCAESPQKLEYPMHQEHPLSLRSHPQYQSGSCLCNVCGVQDWKWFIYQCASCDYVVCLSCVLQDRNFHHEAHDHPLTLMPREALFRCYACNTEAKDLSYFCTTCLFWIHQSCATAPTTLNCELHEDHPLVLAYSLPEQYLRFWHGCSICRKKVFQNSWIYHCADCRFLAHIKCATSREMLERLKSRSRENENIDEGDDEANLVHFPVPDEPSLGSLISQFVKAISLTDDTSTAPDHINHWAHEDHPLVLFHEFERNNNNEMKNEVVVCDGCVQPLTADPFYGCLQCKYFLHKYCAELPKELQHLSHPEHKLIANQYATRFHFFKCDFCLKCCNGIYYCCGLCNFYMDVVCASLPNKIKHESHAHPLKQRKISHCDASEDRYSGFGFGCETCSFDLSKSDAVAPATVRHRWDPHPLHLMHPPVKHHPHEFDCEVCSIYINPNWSFYHCRDCDMSFHIGCLRDDFYSNVKFGATVKIDNLHPHRLTFVQSKKKKARCPRCRTRGIRFGSEVLECAPCKFVICTWCGDHTILSWYE